MTLAGSRFSFVLVLALGIAMPVLAAPKQGRDAKPDARAAIAAPTPAATSASPEPARKNRKKGPTEDEQWHDLRKAARATIDRQDLLTQATFWAGEYQQNPRDRTVALRFAEALRATSAWPRMLEVAEEALANFGEDTEFSLLRAQALTRSDRAFEAVQAMRLLRSKAPRDVRVETTLGIALDVTGLRDEAEQAHRRALELKPDDPKLLSNLGFSLLLAGKPDAALPILERAHDGDRADIQIAQNLMVALGVQGRFEEAKKAAATALPPELAENNLAYLRAMLSEQRRWGRLSGTASTQ